MGEGVTIGSRIIISLIDGFFMVWALKAFNQEWLFKRKDLYVSAIIGTFSLTGNLVLQQESSLSYLSFVIVLIGTYVTLKLGYPQHRFWDIVIPQMMIFLLNMVFAIIDYSFWNAQGVDAFEWTHRNDLHYFQTNFYCQLFYAAGLMLLIKMKNPRSRFFVISNTSRIFVGVLISAVTAYGFINAALIMSLANQSISFAEISLFLFSILVCILIFLYLISQISKKEALKREIENQSYYNDKIAEMVDEIKGFQHAYVNMLSTLQGYVKMNRYSDLESFLDQVIDQERESTHGKFRHIKNIGDAGVFSMIMKKCERMDNDGIDVSVFIPYPLKTIPLRMVDFSELIGNLLDNAYEAAIKCAPEGYVKIEFLQSDTGLTVRIQNTFCGEVLLSKIDEKGYSTKGEGRGLGLWRVKSIIKKNKNILFSTAIEGEYFIQSIYLENL